jgi:metal-responsive CopG/Arc/MetJ family transcriptional regulator
MSVKVAISIPDEIFDAGERLSRRLKTSRSQLYARALTDFVIQHDEDKVTATMNQVLNEVGAEVDDFSRRAANQTLRRVEW